MSYEIFNEDCIEGMKRIETDSVDCILTDLPYNLTDCSWDKVTIDLPTLWTEFNRILKPCCSAVLFASGKFTHKLIASNFDRYKYKWIWVKNVPTMFVHAKNAPMRKFEEICVFSDGVINHETCTKRRMHYNPQGLTSCQIYKDNKRLTRTQVRDGKSFRGAWHVQKQKNYPSDLLTFEPLPNNGRCHPTQKPTDLLEYLIKTYTNEGELVLDATMGSGSTGVAAINTGRRFIGFETETKFYEIAKRRIDEAIAQREQSLFKLEA